MLQMLVLAFLMNVAFVISDFQYHGTKQQPIQIVSLTGAQAALRRITPEAPQPPAGSIPFRVMTFNTWNNGRNVHNGLAKIAIQILEVNPDIVALQEIETEAEWKQLIMLLGDLWNGVYRNASYPDSAILTRHTLDLSSCAQSSSAIGCKIHVNISIAGPRGTGKPHIPDKVVQVNFWSLHLDWRNYGPYAACNRKVKDPFQIEAGEYNLGMPTNPGRAQNMLELSQMPQFVGHMNESHQVPVIVAGDFNAPSHFDWINATKSKNCDWSFEWPATKILNYRLGFRDAYREIYPDPAKHPGVTWSTVQKNTPGWGWTIPEPQDRIDYIHYKGAKLKPINGSPYQGYGHVLPKPFYQLNDWPSDHYSVIIDFHLSTT